MTTSTLPEDAALLAAAQALAPDIAATQAQADHDRCLSPHLMEAFAAAGFFRMWLPADLGGLETDVATLLRVVEAVATIDGSTGWNLMIGAASAVFAGYLPAASARAIYGADPNIVTAGNAAPKAQAVRGPDGYRVSGRWPFASGCQHCRWLFGGTLVVDQVQRCEHPDGMHETRLVFFPADQAQILDTWAAGGLRGTGSHDVVITDLFVPEPYGFDPVNARSSVNHPLYRGPARTWLGPAVAAVPLGIARAAIDALVALAGEKVPTNRHALLRERVLVQTQVAQAEALLRSARAFLHETVAGVWCTVRAGDEPSMTELHLLRLACVHAAESAVRAVDLVYRLGGGSSVYTGSPLDRCLRDVHVATQHITLAAIHYELAGRIFLGLEPGTLAS